MHESKVLQCFRSRPNHRSKRHPLHSTGVFKDVNRKGRITVKEWTHSKCTPYGDPSLENGVRAGVQGKIYQTRSYGTLGVLFLLKTMRSHYRSSPCLPLYLPPPTPCLS